MNWTRGETLWFLGLGVDLFHARSDHELSSLEIRQQARRERCSWCGKPLDDCIRGKRGTCGFAIAP
jgi:hypothetical protein